ncbi:MAG: ferritin [Elusimicrobiota bacterium]|jgi:ferritin
MLNKKMTEALNGQITKELYSAYLYMSMAGYFENKALAGLAKWMRVQAQEESCHALILFNYVCDQGAAPAMGAITAPPAAFKSPVDVFQQTLKHERVVTASINDIVDLSLKLRDHATKQFLEWFVKEQVEEESSADTMLQKIERVGTGEALFVLDKDAGARMFVLPTPLTGKI